MKRKNRKQEEEEMSVRVFQVSPTVGMENELRAGGRHRWEKCKMCGIRISPWVCQTVSMSDAVADERMKKIEK